jgi:hypothetical protein
VSALVSIQSPSSKCRTKPNGWDQINIELPEDVVDDLASLAIANNVSIASALYTASRTRRVARTMVRFRTR